MADEPDSTADPDAGKNDWSDTGGPPLALSCAVGVGLYSTDRIDEVEMMGGTYGSKMALEVDAKAVLTAVRLSETVKTCLLYTSDAADE